MDAISKAIQACLNIAEEVQTSEPAGISFRTILTLVANGINAVNPGAPQEALQDFAGFSFLTEPAIDKASSGPASDRQCTF